MEIRMMLWQALNKHAQREKKRQNLINMLHAVWLNLNYRILNYVKRGTQWTADIMTGLRKFWKGLVQRIYQLSVIKLNFTIAVLAYPISWATWLALNSTISKVLK